MNNTSRIAKGATSRVRRAAQTVTIAIFTVVGALAGSGAAQADPVADFYHGKTLRMIIGYGPGGGYDLYGRLAAEFLARHIPGHPTIMPQNMPGAGSFVAAKYMYEVAPKDGTYLASLSQTLAMDTASGSVTGVDASKMHYLGRITTNIDTGVALPKAGIKSFENVRKRAYSVGVTGGASTAVLLPTSLNKYAGAKFKLVRGYKGSTDIVLAMERGEVDLTGAVGLPLMTVRHPDWLNGAASIIYQAALKRHRLLPNVPTLPELGQTDEGKAVLRVIGSTAEIGRSIITTPGVPPERLAALRKAFAAMLQDADFLAQCKKRNIMVDPGTGEEMDAIVKETVELPKAIIGQVAGLVANK